MKETAPDMKIRLPRTLRDQIEAAARDNRRTLNAEITARLEQSFAEPAKPALTWPSRIRAGAIAGMDARLRELEARIVELEAWKRANPPKS